MPHNHHQPGREPSTTSASSSTSSKTSLTAAKAARSVILPEQLQVGNTIRVPATRIHPHHLHHHPRYGYLYPPVLDENGYPVIQGAPNPPVILIRNRSPKTVRRSKHPYQQGSLHPPHLVSGLRPVPLNKRRGVSVEPVLLQRRNSGSSGRSNESRPQFPKLTTPTISFGDKMAGLKEATNTMKLFGPIKKRSQATPDKTLEIPTPKTSVDPLVPESEDKSVLGAGPMPPRKNSSDALRNAVQHSKAALKKGLKMGSTGLTELRKHVHPLTPQEAIVTTPEKMTIEKMGYGFTNEEEAVLFGLDYPDEQSDSKPDISVYSLSSYTQIDPSFISKPHTSDLERATSEPLLVTDDILTITPPVLTFDHGGILKHSCSPVEKNFPTDIPEITDQDKKGPLMSPHVEKQTTVRRVVTFSMPSGSKWKASQSSLSISTPDLRSLQQSSIEEDDAQLTENVIPTSITTTTTSPQIQYNRSQVSQPNVQEVLPHQQVVLPLCLVEDSGNFVLPPEVHEIAPVQKPTFMTTSDLLLRAQALLSSETDHDRWRQSKKCYSSSYNSTPSSNDDDESDCKECAAASLQASMRPSRKGRSRGYKGSPPNGVEFEIGSPARGPEYSRQDSQESDFMLGEELSERLREMDVTDLTEQRDILTRQIATSLVALHQVNQELDRRRRRKSYSSFRKRDPGTWPGQERGSSFKNTPSVSCREKVSPKTSPKKDKKVLTKRKSIELPEPEAAKPVLLKSLSYPFLCERMSSTSQTFDPNCTIMNDNDDEEEYRQNLLDSLWNDFITAPETVIDGSEDVL